MREKIGIFFIIAGVVLIIFSFLRFDPYYSNTPTPLVSFPVSIPNTVIAGPTPTGRITPEAVSTQREEPEEFTGVLLYGLSQSGYLKSQENQKTILETGKWKATDYSVNDVTGKEYTVQLGDTLWEISEGFYGTGTRWGEILSANLGKIGSLPNGEQSLIYPGQVLILNK